MMCSPPLEIQLLGPVEIKYKDKGLKIQRRIERAILYYLAVENRPVSRTVLIDKLWPDAEQTDPRSALRTALSRLRNKLPDPNLLITELDQVYLDPDRCEIDLINFENAYQNLRNILMVYQENQPLPMHIIKQISETLGLWHGDTIMHGDNLDSYPGIEIWRQTLNRKLSHQRKFLLLRLAQHYRAAGQLDIALDFFIQLGQMDSLDVPTHLSIVDILTKLGRYQDAVDYCDVLENIYEHEFNTPLPDAILRRCQHSQIRADASKKQPERHWPNPVKMQFQFVNRQSELKQLRQAFYRGGVIKLQGEMGTGKTRLVQEFFQMLTPKPALILSPCREMENTLPFSPIIHGLRRHVGNEIWVKIDTVWANQLSLLLPELASIRDDCHSPKLPTFPSGKQHLLDAIHHVLLTVARESGRILFFLDDAQWADKQSLQALSYLIMQDFFTQYGLLIIATRPEEPNQELDDMADQLYRTHPFEVMKIKGLSPNELLTLAHQALGEQPSALFMNKLYRETNGNPFITLEIIRNVLESHSGVETLKLTSALPLPDSVQALIRKRFNRLDEDFKHILVCAAVIGGTFSLDLLRSVAELNNLSELTTLDPLIQLGFFQSNKDDNTGLVYLHFPHEKFREVILKEASHSQLLILHQRVAHHLAQSPQAKEKAVVIAGHYLAGGDVSNAFCWFLRAAAHAWTLGAREETLISFQQAESLVKNAPTVYFTDNDIFQLYQQWSEFAYQSNQIELLEKIGAKLQNLGGKKNNPLLMGIAQMALANACFLRSEIDDGLRLIKKAIDYLEVTDKPRALIPALVQQGTYQWWEPDYDAVLQSSTRLLEIKEKIVTRSERKDSSVFHAKFMTGMAYYAQGEATKALQCAKETYKDHFHKLDLYDQMRSYNGLAYANLISGEIETSQGIAQEALKISRTLDNNFIEMILLIHLSKAEVIQGYLDEAYKHAKKALNLGKQQNKKHAIVTANCILGDIFFLLQNYTLAAHYYRVAQSSADITSCAYHTMENNIHLARLLTWTGQLTEAREIINSTLVFTERTGMGQMHILVLLLDGLCDLFDKYYHGAEDKFLKALNLSQNKGLKYEFAWCQAGLARLEMSMHQFDSSASHIKALLDESQSRNFAWLSLYGLELYSQLQKVYDQPAIPIDYRSTFNKLMNKFAEHTQSDPLRGDFENARRRWEEGHHYP